MSQLCEIEINTAIITIKKFLIEKVDNIPDQTGIMLNKNANGGYSNQKNKDKIDFHRIIRILRTFLLL